MKIKNYSDQLHPSHIKPRIFVGLGLIAALLGGSVIAQPDTPVGIPDDPNGFLLFTNQTSPLYKESLSTATAYYAAIDPDNTKTTLFDFKRENGLNTVDALAVYVNDADLGFGRRMYARTNPDGSVSSCVENYGGATDQDKLNNAKFQSPGGLVATVCMEYSGTPGVAGRGTVLLENDNASTSTLNSKITTTLAAGTYNLVAASAQEYASGNFTLTAKNSAGTILKSLTGTWPYSGGKNPFSSSNPFTTLTLTASTAVTVDLTSSSAVDTYLYVMKKTVTANKELMGRKYIKFYAYGNDVNQTRIYAADLDARDSTRRSQLFIPGACTVCHGGAPKRVANGIYPDLGDTDTQWLPWDLNTFIYDTDPAFTRAAQESKFKILQRSVLATYPAAVKKSWAGTVAIPDASTTGVTLSLPVSGVKGSIEKITLSFNGVVGGTPGLTHPNPAELTFDLISPNGRTYTFITAANTLVNANLTQSYMLDEAEQDRPYNINGGSWTGNWRVGGQFSYYFNGENPNGTWKLIVKDTVLGNTGTVSGWSLHFNGLPEAVRVPAPVELIRGWYGGATLPSATFNGNFVPTGWQGNVTVNGKTLSKSNLYLKVVGPNCRACHVQRGKTSRNELDFASYDKFMLSAKQIETLVYDKGLMPLAKRTYQNHFWKDNSAEILGDYLPGFSHRVPGSATAVLKPGRPIANAGVARTGVLSVLPNQLTRLNGQASIFAKTFSWTMVSKPAGSLASLTNPLTATPTFTPDLAGNYQFSLIVNNGVTNSTAATTTVTASSSASPPVTFSTQITGYSGTPIYSSCSGTCHTGWGANLPYYARSTSATSLATTYDRLIERIDLFDPVNSMVMRKNLGEPHAGAENFLVLPTDPSYIQTSKTQRRDIMWRWIIEGAPKN